MEYYSAIMKDQFNSSVGKWMQLETMVSEITQTQECREGMVSLRRETQSVSKFKGKKRKR